MSRIYSVRENKNREEKIKRKTEVRTSNIAEFSQQTNFKIISLQHHHTVTNDLINTNTHFTRTIYTRRHTRSSSREHFMLLFVHFNSFQEIYTIEILRLNLTFIKIYKNILKNKNPKVLNPIEIVFLFSVSISKNISLLLERVLNGKRMRLRRRNKNFQKQMNVCWCCWMRTA